MVILLGDIGNTYNTKMNRKIKFLALVMSVQHTMHYGCLLYTLSLLFLFMSLLSFEFVFEWIFSTSSFAGRKISEGVFFWVWSYMVRTYICTKYCLHNLLLAIFTFNCSMKTTNEQMVTNCMVGTGHCCQQRPFWGESTKVRS
jgi:hypothetical protein